MAALARLATQPVALRSAQPDVQPGDRLAQARTIARTSLAIMQEFAGELGRPRLVLIGRRFLVITLSVAELGDEAVRQLRRYRLIRELEQQLQLPVMAEHRMATIEFALDLGVPPALSLTGWLANLARRRSA